MKQKKYLYRKSVYIVFFIVSFVVSTFIFVPKPQIGVVDTAEANPLFKRVVALTNTINEGKNGTTVLRLRDALGQFFEGDYSVAMSPNGINAVLYKEHQAFFVMKGEKIFSTSVKESFGKIKRVTFSPDGEFSAIETGNDTSGGSFCLIKVALESTKIKMCNKLHLFQGTPRSTWVPNQGHNFVILNGTQVTAWNLDDTVWSIISQSQNPLIISYVSSLVNKKEASWSSSCLLARCYIHDEHGTSLFKTDAGLFDDIHIEHVDAATYAVYNRNFISLVDISAQAALSINTGKLPATLTADSRLVSHELWE